jgi:hypothetical protein
MFEQTVEYKNNIRAVEQVVDANWRFETDDLSLLRSKFSDRLLVSLCRGFVCVDRLGTCLSMMDRLARMPDPEPPAIERDRMTIGMLVFSVLRELSLVINSLNRAGIRRWLDEANEEKWDKLRELEKRWDNKDDVFRTFRNKVAVHVDPKIVRKGLAEMCKGEKTWKLIEGKGSATIDVRFTLGTEAQLAGFGLSEEEGRSMLRSLRDDHLEAYGWLVDIFSDMFKKVAQG